MLAVSLCVPAQAAYANPLEDFGNAVANFFGLTAEEGGAQTRAVNDHASKETVSPQGTTINVFDYWTLVENPSANNSDYDHQSETAGINGGHQLKFHTGTSPAFNQWTRSEAPFSGIVEKTLENGYPVLSGTVSGSNGRESLAYLFNANDVDSSEGEVAGKRAYMDAKNLLQVDSDGYYYYNSTQSFASLDRDTKSFDVWNVPAVSHGGAKGQFFPFNEGEDVYTETSNGVVAKNMIATTPVLNHYFGLSMTTRFIQSNGGHTANGEIVTYEFSGDDDVWVFIDDVLVGDLGGIHNAASLSIDFSNGEIKINGARNGTLLSKFREAGAANTTQWNGNTFEDDTLHTLKFFYLERGNVASNMNLKFNLVTVPESTVVKVDQEGNPVSGASFKLYAADDKYTAVGDVLAEGTTDGNGRLTLVDNTDTLITFDDLYKKTDTPYFVLKETAAPEGYRLCDDIHIEYSLSTGVVFSTNYWETGAYANASESITTPAKMLTQAGKEITINGKNLEYDGRTGGTLFAVVLHRDAEGSVMDPSKWHGVYGSTLADGGWQLTEKSTAGMAGVIEAVNKGGAHKFSINSNGLFQVDIAELPGNIEDYFWVTGDTEKAEYVVSFYYTTANDLNGATAENTVLVQNPREGETDPSYDTYGFHRQFAATFNVPDMYNRLLVQKVDENGTPVEGAEFYLYDEYPKTDNLEEHVVASVTTEHLSKAKGDPINLDGAGYFAAVDGLVANKDGSGKHYWVREVKAPAGYEINDQIIEVYVDGTGVYANAGNADDGVTVRRGAGLLSATMKQFAINDALDNTLADIKLTLQTGDPEKKTWADVTDDTKQEIHLSYGADDAALEYGPADKGGERAVWSDTGWPLARITQCFKHDGDTDTSKKTDLQAYFGNGVAYNLRSIFSGTAIIRVANQQVNDLEISKEVKGYDGITDAVLGELQQKEFEFTLTLGIPQNVSDPQAQYNLVDGDGNAIKDPLTGADITFTAGENQQVSFKLKHGQKAFVKGLPVGATYSVTEAEADGFKTDVVSSDADSIAADSIRQGNLADADATLADDPEPDSVTNPDGVMTPVRLGYTNTYGVDTLTLPEGTFKAQKVFVDDKENPRGGWQDGDTYPFWLVSPWGAPLPEGLQGGTTPDTTVTPGGSPYVAVNATKDNKDNVTFGEIKFAKPGVYSYLIWERTQVAGDNYFIPGVDYSYAYYRVGVTVEDKLDGTMEMTNVSMTQIADDAGVEHENPVAVDNKTAVFTNTYDVDATTWAFIGAKTYTDSTGAKPIADNAFTFRVEPQNGAPTPEGVKLAEDGSYTIANVGNSIAVPAITFTSTQLGTYTYKVTEVIPEGATDNKNGTFTKDGMTYDAAVWTVTVEVKEGADAGNPLITTTKYERNNGETADAEGVTYTQLNFVNSYDAQDLELSGDTALKGSKTLVGRELNKDEDEKFNFVLTAPAGSNTEKALGDNSIVLGGKEDATSLTAEVNSLTADGKGNFSFGSITFKKPGTYTFNINEVLPDVDGDGVPDADANGMTWDRHTATATVTVKDNNGVLELVSVVYDNGANGSTTEAAFVNTYAATGAVTVQGLKALTGRTLESADTFSFEVAAEPKGSPMPSGLGANGVLKPTYTTGTSSKVLDFGTITFTKAGTYTYTFKEVLPTDDNANMDGIQSAGVTYDQTVHTLEIDVKDNGNGTLSVELATLNDGTALTDATGDNESFDITGVNWTNAYSASGTLTGATQFGGTKVLEGRDWTDTDEFTFTLAGGDQRTIDAIKSGEVKLASAPAETETETTAKDAAEFSFGDITFTKGTTAGNSYKFVVTEDLPTDDDSNKAGVQSAGITYDEHSYYVYVSVTDNGDGTLTPGVSKTENSSEWVNTYGSVVPEGGHANTDARFTKSIDGRDWKDTDEFTFTLTPVDGAPLRDAEGKSEDNRTATASGANAKDGKVSFGFGTLYYNFSDIENEALVNGKRTKTFTYQVTENDTLIAGIAKDTRTAKLKVTLTDDGAGNLTASSVVVAENASFVNTYSTEVDYNALAGMEISKKLTGRDMTAGQFEWTVTPQDTKGEKGDILTPATDTAAKFGITGSSIVVKSSAAKNGTEAFMSVPLGENVKFTNADAGQVYTFRVEETKGGDETKGYTNDKNYYSVTVAPTFDESTGVLTVTTTVQDAANKPIDTKTVTSTQAPTDKKALVTIPFENSYFATTDIEGGTPAKIEGTKTLTGRKLVDGEFKFKVTDRNGKEITTGTNDINGKVTFGTIDYTVATLTDAVNGGSASMSSVDGKRTWTIPYTVSEVTDGLPDKGITVVAGSFQVGVAVTDNGDGTLTSEVLYPNGGLAFENAYGSQSSAELNIVGKKVYDKPATSNAPDITGKFTFTLGAANDTPMPDSLTATNDAAGNVSFGKIAYTMENVFGKTDGIQTDDNGKRYKTFAYTVTESGDVAGVDNDDDAERGKTFTVTVKDKGDGTLGVETSATASAPLFQFTNTYSVTPEKSSVTDQISITKKLDGRNMEDGEFTFQLVEMVDGKEVVVATGVNAADGTVTFDAIEYAAPGEHDYLVREVIGDKGGVTYDTRTFRIHASVNDDGEGALTVKHVAMDRDAISFVNTYEAVSTSATPGAFKMLEGSELKEGQFTFQMLDAKGEVFRTATNAADGAATFPTIEFTEAGAYTYTIVEKNDGQEGVTYDGAEFEVKITVTDDGLGHLEATTEYVNGAPVFKNTYTEPVTPVDPGKPGSGGEPQGPTFAKTNDGAAALMGGLAVLAVAACAGIAVAVFKLRRGTGAFRRK